MKAVLKLEMIADNLYEYRKLEQAGRITRPLPWRRELDVIRFARPDIRPWVARLTGRTGRGFEREFLRFTKDYTHANSEGSRGVYLYFVLDTGIYEINERISWERARRYYVRVQGETITEISREEAIRCLSASASASMS